MIAYHGALLRYVHEYGAGEFVNVGVVLIDAERRRVLYKLTRKYGRFSKLFSDFDGKRFRALIDLAEHSLKTVPERLRQERGGIPREAGEAFEALLTPYSSCFQWSPVMPGAVDDLNEELEALYHDYIGRHEHSPRRRQRRDASSIKERVDAALDAAGLGDDRVMRDAPIKTPTLGQATVGYGWRNGRAQYADPLSLDLSRAGDIESKALQTRGWIEEVYRWHGEDFGFTPIVAWPREHEMAEVCQQAQEIIESARGVRKVISDEQPEALVEMIQQDLAYGD